MDIGDVDEDAPSCSDDRGNNFSSSTRPLDEVIEIWESSMSISVCGTPTLKSVAFNLLTLAGNSIPLNLVVLISSRRPAREFRVTISVFV